jgi:hypothetical protein
VGAGAELMRPPHLIDLIGGQIDGEDAAQVLE